ncbi:MAG TPA: STAS domain-containing protein [Thermomonospora sp.]|nr:STAS domain-containing protein [Thermomonospora sp.]
MSEHSGHDDGHENGHEDGQDEGALRIARTTRPPGLSLAGEIDDVTYPALVAALDGLARDRGTGDLHLDLSRVVFCDVAGLRAMVGLAERLGGGRRLVLHAPAPPLRTVLRVVGWNDARGLVVEP